MHSPRERKLIVWVGGSSGLGFSAIESLLATGESYRIALGSRKPLEPWRYGELQPQLQSSRSTLDRFDLDLTKTASIMNFVESVKERYYDEPVEALVLCAATITREHRITPDGEDEMLKVNVLSHAMVIDRLYPRLGDDEKHCRVLIVSSGLHRKVLPGTVSPDNIEEKVNMQFDSMEVYHITKFLQIFLLYLAQERFDNERKNVSVVAMTPGFIPDTGLSRELGTIQNSIMQWVMPRTPFATTIADGGRNICRGVTQEFPSGTYFSQRLVDEPAEECYDLELRERWKQWFIAKGVWHPSQKIVTPARSKAELTDVARQDEVSSEPAQGAIGETNVEAAPVTPLA